MDDKPVKRTWSEPVPVVYREPQQPTSEIASICAERERIARAGADFFQNGDFDTWESPRGRVFEDLGNGWRVGYDMMMGIINKDLEQS
jgi:hypothetical protein